MAVEYPFPIPEAIQNKLFKAIAQAGPPWQGLDDWHQSPDDPAMFGYFNCWYGRGTELVEALKLIVSKCVPLTYKNDYERATGEACTGGLYALEAHFMQFAGVLEWARLTWPHDPQVCSSFKPDNAAGGEA
jgi:hypothetical protein